MSEITFSITMDDENLNFTHKTHEESTSFVDEESLMGGTSESRETTGFLPTSTQQNSQSLEFLPLDQQQALLNLGLKSKGCDLHYELTHNNTLLIATSGDTNIAVFTVYLDQNGAYTFTLHNPIDRAPPANLLNTNSWTQGADNIVYQEIKTHPLEAYHLSFGHVPSSQVVNPIQVHWGEKLLYTINPDQAAKAYAFSVEGGMGETKLQFTGLSEENLTHCLSQVSVTSAAQQKLPIDLGYYVLNNDNETTQHQFTVNVTTTPPIQINNQQPVDVIYDQAVYQTIVVSDQNEAHITPTARINLDNLFKNLAIPAENRVVEVVQREENGNATNIYEVKISDKNQNLDPITVADVKLSFPGGEGGLSVFQKHIIIDEGGGGILAPQDSHFI